MEVAHGIGAALAPAHAGAFETLRDDSFAGRFDWAGADLPAVGDLAGIIHFVFVVHEVLQFLPVTFPAVVGPIVHIELFPSLAQRAAAFVFKRVAPGLRL